jgi:hypothetical protein
VEATGFDVVMIGNAAAALQGAPVTTVDIDFLFRPTAANIRKLKAIAVRLEAVLLRPYYPVSGLYRIMRDSDGLQLDFMGVIHGIRSYEGLRKRSIEVRFGAARIRVATLGDIIKSKKAAGRPRDLAVIEQLEKTLGEAANPAKDTAGGSQTRD